MQRDSLAAWIEAGFVFALRFWHSSCFPAADIWITIEIDALEFGRAICVLEMSLNCCFLYERVLVMGEVVHGA